MGNKNSGASASSVMVAFLSGMAFGAVAALLLAPQAGRESRETLFRTVRQAGDDVRDFSERATDTWDDVMNKGRDFLNEAGTVVKDAVDAGRESVQQMRVLLQKNPIRHGDVRDRHRVGGSRPTPNSVENVLRLCDGVRITRQHSDLSRLPGIARCVAGRE